MQTEAVEGGATNAGDRGVDADEIDRAAAAATKVRLIANGTKRMVGTVIPGNGFGRIY